MPKGRSARSILVLLLLVAAAAVPLSAQTVTGTMNGNITDRSGAALPGVTVTIRDSDTGLERVVVTNESGFFNAPFLPIGRYTVTAELAGLGSARRADVPVNLNQTTRQDFAIDPQMSETITVNAEAPRINVTDGEVKQTMRATEIMNIPQGNQTNFLGLAATFSGYQENPTSGQDNPTTSSGSSANFNGAGTRGTTFQINGVNNDDSSENQNRQGVALATIKSFQVLSNSFSSEFGRGYGAVVLVQTKSGTNALAGEVYGYGQDGQWNERNILTASTVAKPSNYRRQAGAAAGFPILRDKLFAFGNIDIVDNQGDAIVTKALLRPSVDLTGPRLNLGNDTPENRAWQDMIVARFPQNLTPNAPNIDARAYQYPQFFDRPQSEYSGRLDFNPTSSNTFTGRYQYNHQKFVNNEIIIGEQTLQDNRQSNFGFNWTNTLSSNTVQEARYGLGLRDTNVNILAGNDTPVVRFTGITNGAIIGNAGTFPINRDQRDQQFVYNISSARWANHTLKVGTDIRRSRLDDRAQNFNRGFWTFTTSCGGVTYPTAYAAFWAGCVSTYQEAFGPDFLQNELNEQNFYAQDDWRPWDNLVLNLGVRYERVEPAKEKEDRIDYLYGTTQYVDPRLGFAYTPDWDGNRFLRAMTGGNGRFSIRGGYGHYHGRVFQSVFSQSGISVRYNPPNAFFFNQTGRTNISDPTNGFTFVPGTPPAGIISGLALVDPDLQMPETRQWNLTLERQVFAQSRVRLSYVATIGKNLLQYKFQNLPELPGAPGSGSKWVLAADLACAGTGFVTGVAVNAACPTPVPIAPNEVSTRVTRTAERRPNPLQGTHNEVSNFAESSYHAGQFEFETGLIRGFAGRVTYTYGKALDTGSEATNTGVGDLNIFPPDYPEYRRGLSRFDTRHRFTMTGSYQLPFFRGRNDLVGSLLGGWQLSTVIRLSSGTPFTIVDSGATDIDLDGVQNLRPVCVIKEYCGGWHVNNPNTSLSEMPRNAFRRAVIGDKISDLIGRNTFFTDGAENVDLGLYKSFKVGFGLESILLRADVFNVLNHTTWGFPVNNIADANFGRILATAYTPRTFQVGARFIF
jgi:hypothetical protein